MSFNTYPQNPFPSNSEMFQKLDAVAKAIDNMPTFTSNDKVFLEELPAFPNVDGKKVLTANTTSGETSLAYEALENELPANPSSDGVRVLTATTESGETVKSWEELQTGENRVYSTTVQDIGVWIDGTTKVKRVVINLESATTFKNNDWVQIPLSGSAYSIIINACAIGSDGAYCPLVVGRDSPNTVVLSCRVDSPFVASSIIIEYVVPIAP